MMDVREKLIDLLTGHSIDTQQDVEYVADHLISSGVTVHEWISVDDRLPEPEQDVILCTSEIETYGRHSEKKENLSQYLYGLLRWRRMAYELLLWLRVHFQDERKISKRND